MHMGGKGDTGQGDIQDAALYNKHTSRESPRYLSSTSAALPAKALCATSRCLMEQYSNPAQPAWCTPDLLQGTVALVGCGRGEARMRGGGEERGERRGGSRERGGGGTGSVITVCRSLSCIFFLLAVPYIHTHTQTHTRSYTHICARRIGLQAAAWKSPDSGFLKQHTYTDTCDVLFAVLVSCHTCSMWYACCCKCLLTKVMASSNSK